MNRETLVKVRRLLVELYDDPMTIRRVIADAGLNSARINLGGSALNMWHAVLDEAQKSGLVAALAQVAIDDYPNREQELRQLFGTQDSSTPAVDVPRKQSSPNPAAVNVDQTLNRPQTEAPAVATPRHIEIDVPRTMRLSDIERQLLGTCFTQASKLKLVSEFTDGRTATRVFLVRPTDSQGVLELPVVVKMGPHELIAQEWRATETHVLRRLPGFAPVQGEPIYLAAVDGTQWGTLGYGQVGEGLFPVESLAQYSTDAPVGDIWHVLQNRLLRQLREFWQSTQQWETFTVRNGYDSILPVNLAVVPLPIPTAPPGVTTLDGNEPGTLAGATRLQSGMLVRITHFVVTEVSPDRKVITLNLPLPPDHAGHISPSFRLRLALDDGDQQAQLGGEYPEIVGHVNTTLTEQLADSARSQLDPTIDLTAVMLPLPEQPGSPLPNPLIALPTLLDQAMEGWVTTIHGDLNLRNILVDPEARTAAVIDCAAAHHNHVLHDLLRMERDTVTDLLTKLFFQHQLSATTIIQFYRCLHCALRGEVQESGRFSLPRELDPVLYKPFIMLATLRGAAREFLRDSSQWEVYYTGLVIHLLGALKFSNLSNPVPGHEPKALAFWGAAVTLQLLRDLEEGNDQRCQDLTWFPFNVMTDNLMTERAAMQGDGLESMGPDESGTLGTKSPSLTVPNDVAPVQRRLDVAAPEQATVNRAFSLAVAVRQFNSPPLDIAELPAVHSGNAQLDWPETAPYVRVRVQVLAPECEIVGEDVHSIKLYHNLDSEIFYFSLIPKVKGRLSIIVRLYQEEDMLGSTLAHTTVSEEMVSEVKVQLRSEPVDIRDERNETSRSLSPGEHPNIKILFLTANPLDMVWLRTDEEARAIDRALRQADHRIFEIVGHRAVRINDLQELLLRYRPDIVHFSGHGTAASELILQDFHGNAVFVRGSALQALFAVLKDNVRCVVLNACYTEEQAQGLAEVIDCVIGISENITDEASLQFATAFYRGLGYGRSVQKAFRLGQVQIELAGLGEGASVKLVERVAGAAAYKFTVETTRETAEVTSTSSATLPPNSPSTSSPVPSAPPVGEPPMQLTAPQKRQFIEVLLACPSIANRQTRDAIIGDLPGAYKSNIRRSDVDRVDVNNLVSTVLNYANGITDLVELIRFYEGDSLAMQQVEAKVHELPI